MWRFSESTVPPQELLNCPRATKQQLFLKKTLSQTLTKTLQNTPARDHAQIVTPTQTFIKIHSHISHKSLHRNAVVHTHNYTRTQSRTQT